MVDMQLCRVVIGMVIGGYMHVSCMNPMGMCLAKNYMHHEHAFLSES